KKSFSKFDDLQKRSLIHIRSRDSNKAKEIFCTAMAEKNLDICHQCQKTVYKMEEVILQLKTGTKIFHKSCLRCKECSKQLKQESYHAHDGNLYCHMHFKLIFAPKIVYEEIKPQKPELIIRENQPMELSPDVARASDKPNLGLDQLQQLNVRSRFEVFENGACFKNNISQDNCRETAITHGKSIRSTLTKLHKLGISNLKSEELGKCNDIEKLDDNSNDVNNDSDDYSQMILTEKEMPLGLGDAINDIRTKFENGEMITKEERREERKLEIQGIRSRLFMGKQAKIKELYQQAVAESEQGLTSVGKTANIELTTDTQSIKDRFEKGEAFKDGTKIQSQETIEDAVFESALSKASRNIFMKLDANSASDLLSSRSTMSSNPSEKLIQSNKKNVDMDMNIIKSDAKPEDIKVNTEELTERFKFFEQFRPVERERHIFRITPPREGVVRIDSDADTDISSFTKQTSIAEDILLKTKTTSTILNKFREMEQNKISDNKDRMKQPKPLKSFTPPPEAEINEYLRNINSDLEDEESFSEDEETNTNDGSDDDKEHVSTDQTLQEAKIAARAKQLCAKFEKWQADEIQRELKENREDVYSQLISSDSIESAKIIRERFENMKINGETQTEINVPRVQINRFV
ncbi:hypothetical protein KR032_000897, partial [Drosophila birchii]